jgi:hypothetical protein
VCVSAGNLGERLTVLEGASAPDLVRGSSSLSENFSDKLGEKERLGKRAWGDRTSGQSMML